MLIFIDSRAPDQAKKILSEVGEVIDFITDGICYEAISGHPDIFMFQHPKGLIVAPNLPKRYIDILNSFNIPYNAGVTNVGASYPQTSGYNALFTSYGIIHNTKYSDEKVLASGNQHIFCNQGYVRCNSLQAGKTIITSDCGIAKVLENAQIPSLFISPVGIGLTGFQHGFFGGCCGIWDKKLYICGDPNYLPEAENLHKVLYSEGVGLIKLSEGPLFDIGGIFFIQSP